MSSTAFRFLARLRRRLAAALPGTAMARLIRQTAFQSWPLLMVQLLCTLVLALSEGLSFAVIFQAARLLSDSGTATPVGNRFAFLLAGAVALQALMSLARYGSGVSAGWFAARCQHHHRRHSGPAAVAQQRGITAAAQRLERRANRQERRMRDLSLLVQLLEPVSDLLPVVAAAAIGLLSWYLFKGQSGLLVPNLVVFVLVLQRLNMRLARIAASLNRMAEYSGSMQQVEELLDPTHKQFRRRGGVPFHALQGGIRVEGVSLLYPGRKQHALSGIDLEIPSGGTLALVGESGGGKSSLVNLIVGLLSPTGGRILVDGLDLEQIELESWQQKLGVVSQDVFLLNASIRDNISFALPGADEAAIRAAATAAAAAAFIEALPEGYNTLIGERGFRLSGGQRQRLSLARALLKDPELLILDEATSALDSRSEARILAAAERFARGRTVLTVAHRLSSVQQADLIVVLEAGRIVEQGQHQQLLTLGGCYAELWARQAPRRDPRKAMQTLPEIL